MEITQFCEHAVKQKTEGKWIAKRVGLIGLYTFILLVAALLGLLYKNILPFVVVAGLIECAIVPLTWRRTVLEYEYSMTGGVLTFTHIYGGSGHKHIFSVDLRSIEAAFPYRSEMGMKRLNEYTPEKQYFALASENEEENRDKEIWCCLFEDEDGKKTAFYFELTDTAYRFLKMYANSVTAVRRKM